MSNQLFLILSSLKVSSRKNSTTKGSSLTECLVGIIIITIFLIGSAPPLLLAMSNRVQTRRANEAILLSQSELDRIRLLMESGNNEQNNLPGNSNYSDPNQLSSFPAPTSFCGGQSDPPCPSVPNPLIAKAVNSSGDCSPTNPCNSKIHYFYMQTFRDKGVNINNNPIVFRTGIRIYSSIAVSNVGNLANNTKSPSQGLMSKFSVLSTYPFVANYTDYSSDTLANQLSHQRNFSDKIK